MNPYTLLYLFEYDKITKIGGVDYPDPPVNQDRRSLSTNSYYKSAIKVPWANRKYSYHWLPENVIFCSPKKLPILGCFESAVCVINTALF
jgi:hypothetical protein